ncbi:hypothetical protein LCGC14_2033460 [marine sediment metagenome]|uniref:Ubiquitin-like domain-containing protein n=1 Tax=marine sediment metagenome TaxID=412755 RepID=A0A0F9HQZ3_9ZZZZ|nr:MAG: hypothetical protein Lokiarch_29290 [Candidatus Lokiarchaeum sp. GC14_75]
MKKQRIYGLLVLYFIFALAYLLFFLFQVENSALFLFLTIGSVAVLSSSTIYTVIQSTVSQDKMIKNKKLLPKKKSQQKRERKLFDTIEEYMDALPFIEEYVDSDDSYEDLPAIHKYIFSLFSKEVLYKINLLNLSKIDKIQFIQEMLYFDDSERERLIENMLESRGKTDDEIIYSPPIKLINLEDQIRVYVRSLLEPGEITKLIIIETTELIRDVKKRVGVLFDYGLKDFLLSSGGILLKEKSQIKDYDIDDDDEIALIPSRREKN